MLGSARTLAACAALGFLLIGLAAAAAACPADPDGAPALHLSARQLATPRAAPARAGGTVVLEACAEAPGQGHVPFAPSTVIHLTADRPRHALVIRAEAAGCTPVLLVQTARGNRYASAAAAGPGQATLVLADPVSGRYAIWLGTRDAFGCDARLVIRTARPTRHGRATALR